MWNVDPVTKAPLAINSPDAISGIRWEQQRVEIEKLKELSEAARKFNKKAKEKLVKAKAAASELLLWLRGMKGQAGETTVRALHRYLHFAVKRKDDKDALKLKGKQGAPPRIAAICDSIQTLVPQVPENLRPVFDAETKAWDLPPFVPFEEGIQRVVLVHS